MGILAPAECRRIQCSGGCEVFKIQINPRNYLNIFPVTITSLFLQFVFCRQCQQGYHLGGVLMQSQVVQQSLKTVITM